MITLLAAIALLAQTQADSVAAQRAQFASSLKYQTGDVQLKGGMATRRSAARRCSARYAVRRSTGRFASGGQTPTPPPGPPS